MINEKIGYKPARGARGEVVECHWRVRPIGRRFQIQKTDDRGHWVWGPTELFDSAAAAAPTIERHAALWLSKPGNIAVIEAS